MRKLIPAALLAVALPLTTAATLPPPPIPFCRLGTHATWDADHDRMICVTGAWTPGVAAPVPPGLRFRVAPHHRHHHHRHHRHDSDR